MVRALALSLTLAVVGCSSSGGDGSADAVVPNETWDQGNFDAADAGEPWAGSLTTEDGKRIATRAHGPDGVASGAGVLLVHQFGGDQRQWDPWIADLTARGHLVMTIDLRGHGDSDPQDHTYTGILTDPDGAPRDVAAAVAWLRTRARGVDPDRVAIIGTSIGANLACVEALDDGDRAVKLAVAISPRASSVAALAEVPESDLSFVGLFGLATEQDGGGAQRATVRAFYEASAAPREQLILTGSAHGEALLDLHAQAWPAILSWLDANL